MNVSLMAEKRLMIISSFDLLDSVLSVFSFLFLFAAALLLLQQLQLHDDIIQQHLLVEMDSSKGGRISGEGKKPF